MTRKPATKTRESTTKQERIYGVLRDRIQSGAYEPGRRIVIDQLAAEFGVSALPVREAVRRVQAEGLVVSRPNSSACVAPADPELVDPIIDLLAVVEGYATALAAQNLGEAESERLLALAASMEHAAAACDSGALGLLEAEFHELLEAHCPNLVLVQLLRDLTRRLDVAGRAISFMRAGGDAESVTEHGLLANLLATGQSSADIEQAVRRGKVRREHARLAGRTGACSRLGGPSP